jgi:hypothetical protein
VLDHGIPYASNSNLTLELNELRRITVVFIQMQSDAVAKCDAEGSLNFAQSVMSIIQGPLQKYRGTLR